MTPPSVGATTRAVTADVGRRASSSAAAASNASGSPSISRITITDIRASSGMSRRAPGHLIREGTAGLEPACRSLDLTAGRTYKLLFEPCFDVGVGESGFRLGHRRQAAVGGGPG